MFPTIVRFENGTYAVRRWFLGYEYLDTGSCGRSWFWWPGLPERKLSIELRTFEKAEDLLERYKNRKRSSKKDYGTPVKHVHDR